MRRTQRDNREAMIEFYLPIRQIHIFAALASGALFALRGAAALGGARWPLSAPLRYLSYAIDTTLLTAALMLVSILPAAMFANHWLTLKLLLIVVYVVLGIFAMRRARTRKARAVCYVAALCVFGTVYSIARAHHPLGWLTLLVQ